MTHVAAADPLDPAARHLEAGEYVQALAEARKVLAADAGNYLAMLILASVPVVQRQPESGGDLMSGGSPEAITDPELALAIGNLFLTMRKNDKAIAAFGRAAALRPDHPIVLRHLAYVLRIAGKLEESIAVQERLVAVAPQSTDARITLAETLHEAGEFERSIGVFDGAIALGAGNASIFNTLSAALYRVGQHGRATAAAKKALEYEPNYVAAIINLGNGLRGLGRFDEAEAAGRKAIELAPRFAVAHSNLAMTLNESHQFTKAFDAAEKAIALQPDLAESHVHLANALHGLHRIDEAMVACRSAIAARGDYVNAYLTLSNCLANTGRLPEALAVLRQCMQRNVDNPQALGNLVMMLNNCDAESSRADALAAARQFDERFCKPLRPVRVFDNNREPERLLRIGYVSPDFCDHVVGWNLLPLLREHDHGRFHILCYADVARPDGLTEQIRLCADTWRSIRGLSDQQAAELVRADGVDILVDLSVHSAGNRLLIFARKPAPVQVTFAGYPGSTGLATMDYRLTDPYLDPLGGSDEFYSEKSIRLPHSFWCYEAQPTDPPVNELPALTAGHVTFGSLNTFRKISPATWARWARVLHAVPGSELMVLAPEGSARETATRILSGHGIDPYRFRFISTKPRSQYMSIYHRIDIGLDTLPYNGHTTSLDSYWMGVPVVTLVGQTVVGRAGLSQATNLGLTELIGQTEEEFVAIATKLAGDLPRLSALRRGLRSRMEQSPLCDAKGFTRGIEGAYRQMWRSWCERGAAEP